MVRKIIRDIKILKKRSSPATAADIPVTKDLADTLAENSEICAGMAANMIGVNKRIIITSTPMAPIIMLNPKIISHSVESYESEEGCLSLSGTRKVRRYSSIEVTYEDTEMKQHTGKFSGFTARIIQHEIDHCDGILI